MQVQKQKQQSEILQKDNEFDEQLTTQNLIIKQNRQENDQDDTKELIIQKVQQLIEYEKIQQNERHLLESTSITTDPVFKVQSFLSHKQLQSNQKPTLPSISPQLKKSLSLSSSTSSPNPSKLTSRLSISTPDLFLSAQSLLPNQVICVQNNSTKILIHMNKKITTLQQGQTYLQGRMIITNFKIVYIDNNYPNTMNFMVPIAYVLKLERTMEQSNGHSFLEVYLRTGLYFKIKYHQEELAYSQKIMGIMLTLMGKILHTTLDVAKCAINKLHCRPFKYYFDPSTFSKSLKSLQAQIISNSNWSEMSDYPEQYIIPLSYLGKRKVDTRLIILSYVYLWQHKQQICLWRSGPGLADVFQQQWLGKSKLYTRHFSLQIKNKGIGMSKSLCSRSIQLQSPYHLRQSYQKLFQLTYHHHEPLKWFSNISNGSRWYEQICILIDQAQSVIDHLVQGVNVTVVADTEGRAAQVTAIVQLLMYPQYRTIQGFCKLVEKEFLHFGCGKQIKKQKIQDKSIILIQFLDCVYQFTHFYPLSFQFNEHYLVYIAEHVFSNKFGNFLYITRQLKNQKQRRQIVQQSLCIWQDMHQKIHCSKNQFFSQSSPKLAKSSPKRKQKSLLNQLNYYCYFHNSFYIDHNESNVFELRNHSEISKGVKLWAGYFHKKVFCNESIRYQVLFCTQIQKRYLRIAYQHNVIKKLNQIMRKKLAKQYAEIAEKRKIIKALNQI